MPRKKQRNHHLILMIFRFITILASIIIVNSLSAQSQWYWQNPIPAGNVFTDAHFNSQGHGVVISLRGSVTRTTDGGGTWLTPDSVSNRDLTAVSFINESTGFIAGDNRIYRTLDGGKTWDERYHSEDTVFSVEDYFLDIAFGDQQTGFAVAYLGEVLRTNNGGATWTPLPPLPDNPQLSAVMMRTSNTGIVVGTGSSTHNYSIYRTTDGGDSWTIPAITNKSDDEYIGLNHVTYVDNSIWVGVGRNGVIVRSTDDGKTWNKIREETDIIAFDFYHVAFRDPSNGVAVGDAGKYFTTSDGGLSWNEESIGIDDDIRSIQFLTDGTEWLVGAFNTVYKKPPGANRTSRMQGAVEPVLDIKLFSSTHGIGVGDHGTAVYTTNSGKQWHTASLNSSRTFHSLSLTGEESAIAVGDSGWVIRSTDGGISWSSMHSGYYNTLYGVDFVNSNNGLSVGQSGIILRTTDGGSSWTQCVSNVIANLRSVKWVTQQKAIAVGSHGLITRSTNSGLSWQVVASPIQSDLRSAVFADSMNGIAVGIDGAVIRTTNSGFSWEKIVIKRDGGLGVQIPIEDAFYDVDFITPSKVIVVGEFGSVYRSLDTGKTWQIDTAYATKFFHDGYAVDFLNDTTGTTAGQYGNIIAYRPAGFVPHEPEPEIPETIFLAQNYPNPFNPETRIPYGLTNPGPIKITIYNVLGQEIRTLLVAHSHPAGEFTVTWDGRNRNGRTVASGVYICVMRSGKITKSRKMLYVK
ncbi:T9SS type A sorting domain-containing protein [bacterium]|nr:T9SS type A sorting domain-containing protein [bacterium]